MATASSRARLARIDQRLEAKYGIRKEAPNVEAEAIAESAASSIVLRQVAQSMAALEDLKDKTTSAVTGILVGVDVKEAAVRLAEEAAEKTREDRVAADAAATAQASASIAMRWAAISALKLPEELSKALEGQKSACSAVLAAKDKLMASLRAELIAREDAYAAALETEQSEVDTLAVQIRNGFNATRAEHATQLRAIEAAFVAEREELLASQKREVDALFEARRGLETRYSEDRIAREAAHAAELYNLQAADLENYQKLKVKLEGDCALLEQQLEATRFTYMLNQEKLEYNFRVLSERDAENKHQLSTQKARLARLRAALTKEQTEYAASNGRLCARNDALRKEYERAVVQLSDLQVKAGNVEHGDELSYAAMVRGHDDEIRVLLARVQDADRIITEQLRGGEAGLVAAEAAAGVEGGVGAVSSRGSLVRTAASASVLFDHVGSGGGEGGGSREGAIEGDLEDAPLGLVSFAPGFGGGGGGGVPTEAAGDGALHTAAMLDPSRLGPLLRLLIAETGAFLVSVSTQEACAAMEGEGKAEFAAAQRASAILRAAGADTPELAASLVAHFDAALVAAGAAAAAAAARRGSGGLMRSHMHRGGESAVSEEEGGGEMDEEGGMGGGQHHHQQQQEQLEQLGGDDSVDGEGELLGDLPRFGSGGSGGDGRGAAIPTPVFGLTALRDDGLPMLPQRFSVVATLREWIVMQQRQQGQHEGGGSAAGAVALTHLPTGDGSVVGGRRPFLGGTSSSNTAAAAAAGIRSKGRATNDAARWEALADAAMPSRTAKVWHALEGGLAKYRAVLQQRSAVLTECADLAASNEKLKGLLAQYMSSSSAAALQVHPAHTLRLGLATAAEVSAIARGAMVAGGATVGGAVGGGARVVGEKSTMVVRKAPGNTRGVAGGGSVAVSSLQVMGVKPPTALYRQ